VKTRCCMVLCRALAPPLSFELLLSEQTMHGADRAQIFAPGQQRIIDLRRRLITKFIIAEHRDDLFLLSVITKYEEPSATINDGPQLA
jgi:hypothetical protein